MTNMFDNKNFIPAKQQTYYSLVSPSSTRPDVTNVLWEASSNSPRISASPQPSPRPNHPPPSYEESVFNKALANRHNSQTSLNSPSFRYYNTQSSSNSPNPTGTLLSNENICPISPYPSSDTKPPPPARIPRFNHAIHSNNTVTQFSPNGMKTSTTYLNTTQVYIHSPSSHDQTATPPPPPPRYPLNPPAVPPRASPKPTTPSLHRSSVMASTAKRNEMLDYKALENHFHSLSLADGLKKNDENRLVLGPCHKCQQTIRNIDESCDIFGQLYHCSCAKCIVCGRSVKNKPYLVKDQLYCEEDFLYTGYHQTLEKCVACHHLITDTVLQAMGQSYHLNCFKCSKCFITLDGIPFITDNNKNLFCLHDYHMTYAPRCDKCSNPICPEKNSTETVRIISMGKTFHVQCYRCQDCSAQLSDEPERRCYPLADTLLCQNCCRRRLISAHYQS